MPLNAPIISYAMIAFCGPTDGIDLRAAFLGANQDKFHD